MRKQLKYPPFCDIIVVNFNGLLEEEIKKVSHWVYEYVKKTLQNEQFKVFMPMPAPIDKIQNRYRWRLIIKGNMSEEANEVLNQCLRQVYNQNLKTTRITIDVNPNNMM